MNTFNKNNTAWTQKEKYCIPDIFKRILHSLNLKYPLHKKNFRVVQFSPFYNIFKISFWSRNT